MAAIPGDWLIQHTTPSWRMKDPIKGFQRLVKQERARQIAFTVLDQKRTFPNAIVLATDISALPFSNSKLAIPSKAKFLVVDGQHRLWAQKFSKFKATYACSIHCNLDEIEMAKLFLEINDTQKRVPSSLRWDLVRLVRAEDDPQLIVAADLTYALATEERSPLYQRIDLTGEQGELRLKQGSIAPEIKYITSKAGPIKKADFDIQLDLLIRFFTAIRAIDSGAWRSGTTPFFNNRVIRALLRLLPEIVHEVQTEVEKISTTQLKVLLEKIDPKTLDPDAIKSQQGSAGIREIQHEIKKQMFK